MTTLYSVQRMHQGVLSPPLLNIQVFFTQTFNYKKLLPL